MRKLEGWEIENLQRQHIESLLEDGHPSGRIRKGWEIEDHTEEGGHRLLTDEELAEICDEVQTKA